MPESAHKSYGRILQSTALIGGTQVCNLLIGIFRVKVLALLLGPAGIGLAGMYQAATGIIGTLAGLGIGSAGVRQIAEASASGDRRRVARTAAVLRRASWISGALGMAAVLIFAKPLAQTTFGNTEYAGGVALVSLTLLFGGISAGQTALLQGLRRLRDLAACNLLGSIFGTVASIALVYFLRDKGVAAFLVAVAGFGILTSWWYARKVPIEPVRIPWRETFREARPLLEIGGAFLAIGLIGAGVTYWVRALIIHDLGMHAVGLYTAASNLSLIYIGVVINAMGADFYPRLTAIAQHDKAVNELVNQQAEMGLFLSLPGLLATLTFAPWVLRLFYSAEFAAAADLIRWLILGMGLRVACWPLGYILLAKALGKPLVIIEGLSSLVQVGIVLLCMRRWGLEGCGAGFAIFMAMATVNMSIVSYKITGFTWSRRSAGALAASAAFTGALLLALRLAPGRTGLALGMLVTALATAWSVSNLNRALGMNVFAALRQRFLSKAKPSESHAHASP